MDDGTWIFEIKFKPCPLLEGASFSLKKSLMSDARCEKFLLDWR